MAELKNVAPSRVLERAQFPVWQNINIHDEKTKDESNNERQNKCLPRKTNVLDSLTLTHHLVALARPDSVGFCLKRGFASCAARAGAEGPMSA